MSDRLAIVLASGDPKVLQMGLLYTRNAIRKGWMKEVVLYLFGPSEVQVVTDPRSRELLAEIVALGSTPRACRFCSDEHHVSDALEELGCEVLYVGEPISKAIRDGFTPMVW